MERQCPCLLMTLLLKPAVAEEPLLVVVDVDAEEPPEDLVEPVGSDAGAVVLSDGLAFWEGVKPDKALPLLEGRDWAREGVSGEQLYRHTFGHFRWTRRIVTMSPPTLWADLMMFLISKVVVGSKGGAHLSGGCREKPCRRLSTCVASSVDPCCS